MLQVVYNGANHHWLLAPDEQFHCTMPGRGWRLPLVDREGDVMVVASSRTLRTHLVLTVGERDEQVRVRRVQLGFGELAEPPAVDPLGVTWFVRTLNGAVVPVRRSHDPGRSCQLILRAGDPAVAHNASPVSPPLGLAGRADHRRRLGQKPCQRVPDDPSHCHVTRRDKFRDQRQAGQRAGSECPTNRQSHAATKRQRHQSACLACPHYSILRPANESPRSGL